jgi:hypothetical protein
MMRKWLAEKFFDWAVRLDWDAVFIMSLEVVMIEAKEEKLFTPKKKVGRPLGSKDKKPRNKANMGRPAGSKNKSSSRKNKSSSSEVQP